MIYRFDIYTLDPDRFELIKDARTISIEPKALSVLQYLIENRDRLVTKDELIEQVWDARAVSDWTVSGCIKTARRLLGDTAKKKKFIETVHGKGYRFVGDVTVSERNVQTSQLSIASDVNVCMAKEPAIVILPFVDKSSAQEHMYLADGVSEDITTTLSAIPGLRVMARNLMANDQNPPADILAVSSNIGATHLLQGSIRCHGDRIRVSAYLIETDSGVTLWAERYDRELSDIFALQDDITRNVVSALHIKLVAGERATYWARGTDNFSAWKLQLQATQLIAAHEKESSAKGRELALQAIELDGNYSDPWATLGISYHQDIIYGWDEPLDLVITNALNALQNALDRNPSNPLALATLGAIKLGMRDYDEGFAMCQRAYSIGADSSDVTSLFILGAIFADKAESANRAVSKFKTMVGALDAWHAIILAWFLYITGDLEEALNIALEAIERQPTYQMGHVLLAIIYSDIGDPESAKKSVSTILKLNPRYTVGHAMLTQPYKRETVAKKIEANLIQAGLSRVSLGAE